MEDGWIRPKETIFHDNCPRCGSKIVPISGQNDPLNQKWECPSRTCKLRGIQIDPVEYIYDEEL